MNGRLLIFGGTTEALELIMRGLPAVYLAAEDYGFMLADGFPNAETIKGRMDADAIEDCIKNHGITCVIDATHPCAKEATKNIKAACERAGTPLMRVLREPGIDETAHAETFQDCASAAEYLDQTDGNILLAVGSKELGAFTGVRGAKGRLYARVLPSSEIIKQCEELGIEAGHIIAMQGPFSERLNMELLRATNATFLVTKDGGASGGTSEKLGLARKCCVSIVIVGRPDDEGHSVSEAIFWARRQLGILPSPLFPMLRDVDGRKALIVGGGRVALRRAQTLKKCGARVVIVSPEFCDELECGGFERVARKWESTDFEGACLVVAATDDRAANRRIGRCATRAGIPVSVADAAWESTFFFPSLITDGLASASVSTGGASPKMTRRLADRLRDVWSVWVAEERAKAAKEDESL